MSITIEVSGAVCGTLWMPACKGWREERSLYTLRGEQPFRPRVESIREALERTAAKDGDFQTAGKLTADTIFSVTSGTGRRRITKTYSVLDFPSALADIVDAECFADTE